MSEFLLKKGHLPNLLKHHYYLNSDKRLVRIVNINKKENRVVLYSYDKQEKIALEYDIAPHYLTPLFKIGEVGKILGRSVETIRKYENTGLLPKAKKYSIGRLEIRLYTESDIYELVEFFANRNSVGRPGKLNKVSKINQKEMIDNLKIRLKSVK